MTQLQILQSELLDKLEMFDWLLQDIHDLTNQIEQIQHSIESR